MRRLFVVFLLLLISCGGPRIFINPQADLPYYRKIGILPFSNLSGTREAGNKVTLIFYTELMLQGRFEIIHPGELRKKIEEITENKGKTEELGISEIMKLGEATGAQGFIEGAVVEYSTIRSGGESYPVITLDVRLIDAKFGKVVLEITHTKTGRPKIPIIGIGGVATLPELTQQICQDFAKEITKAMGAGYEE